MVILRATTTYQRRFLALLSQISTEGGNCADPSSYARMTGEVYPS